MYLMWVKKTHASVSCFVPTCQIFIETGKIHVLSVFGSILEVCFSYTCISDEILQNSFQAVWKFAHIFNNDVLSLGINFDVLFNYCANTLAMKHLITSMPKNWKR